MRTRIHGIEWGLGFRYRRVVEVMVLGLTPLFHEVGFHFRLDARAEVRFFFPGAGFDGPAVEGGRRVVGAVAVFADPGARPYACASVKGVAVAVPGAVDPS